MKAALSLVLLCRALRAASGLLVLARRCARSSSAFLPIGLFYQAAFTVARRSLLWLLVQLTGRRISTRHGASRMIPALVVFVYLAIVLYIGIFAFRARGATPDAEDYFLAGRSLGPVVFLLSLFGTNMTAFSILGSSGHAFANGIVTFGLMASSSALVIPVCLFFSARACGRSASGTAS